MSQVTRRSILILIYGRVVVPMVPLPRPVTDTTAVRELCERLVPGVIPKLVEIKAPSWAAVDDCTENVTKVVAEFGGEVVYGWKLVEPLPGLLLEAEFHSVLLNKQGDFLDVSPSAFPTPYTVLLPDSSLTYEGQQINSVRVALVNDPLIAEMIEALEADFEAMNRGDLAKRHGNIVTPEIEASKARLERLFSEVVQKHY